MPRETDRPCTLLVVSGSERFEAQVRKALSGKRFSSMDFRKTAGMARQSRLDRDYDLVVVHCPLPDEFGHEFAIETARRSNASVLLVVPPEIYENVIENVSDYGILALSHAAVSEQLAQALRLLMAFQKKVHTLEEKLQAAQDRMEELRVVSKAKLLLVEKKGMSEDEAHRVIGKLAMNEGVSRRRIAERMLDELEDE